MPATTTPAPMSFIDFGDKVRPKLFGSTLIAEHCFARGMAMRSSVSRPLPAGRAIDWLEQVVSPDELPQLVPLLRKLEMHLDDS